MREHQLGYSSPTFAIGHRDYLGNLKAKAKQSILLPLASWLMPVFIKKFQNGGYQKEEIGR